MKNLKFRESFFGGRHQYCREDIKKIVDVCARAGYRLSEHDAMVAWERYSDQYWAAGWLMLHDDEEIINAILLIMEPEKTNDDLQDPPGI